MVLKQFIFINNYYIYICIRKNNFTSFDNITVNSDDDGYYPITDDIISTLKNHIVTQTGGASCPCDNNNIALSSSSLSDNPINYQLGGGRKPNSKNIKKKVDDDNDVDDDVVDDDDDDVVDEDDDDDSDDDDNDEEDDNEDDEVNVERIRKMLRVSNRQSDEDTDDESEHEENDDVNDESDDAEHDSSYENEPYGQNRLKKSRNPIPRFYSSESENYYSKKKRYL